MRPPCLLKTQFSVVLKTNGPRIKSICRCILAHYLYTPLLYLRRLRYLQLQSASKGFWMFLRYLVVVLGGKNIK